MIDQGFFWYKIAFPGEAFPHFQAHKREAMRACLRRSTRSLKEHSNNPDDRICIPNTIELPLDEERDLLVGRLPRAEGQPDFCEVVRLDYALLSCQHTYVVVDAEGHHCVRDMGTLNGTYVNGRAIPDKLIRLKDGDEIGFGGPRYVRCKGRTVFNPCTYVYERKRKEGECSSQNPVKQKDEVR